MASTRCATPEDWKEVVARYKAVYGKDIEPVMSSELTAPPKGRVITVRLTTKCPYQCAHCCFECGPKRHERMTVEIARQVRTCFEGHVSWLNVMGGEITTIPNYPDLLEAMHFVPLRIVTNGWWVTLEQPRQKFLATVRKLSSSGPPIYIGISRDRFHPAGVGDRAFAWLESQNPGFKEDWGFTATKDPKEEERAVAPVGRAYNNELGDDMLRMFGAYCHAHQSNQSMTVLENGAVTYCNFGAWPMGFLSWKFEELEETRLRMSKVFIPNCVSCWRSWKSGEQKA
jgi:hypothetical protein